MQITKYGHCCLLIEIKGKRILTDLGEFSSGFEDLSDIDVVLITHEHGDHLHTESLQGILKKNPQAEVVTNASVGEILAECDITHTIYEHEQAGSVADIALKAYEGKHVEIVGEYGLVQNTGFLLENGQFFYLGDAYTIPEEAITVLALPVAGPWCKVSEAIAYALKVAPKTVIPVHDAVLSEAGKQVTYPHFERELADNNIAFTIFPSETNTVTI